MRVHLKVSQHQMISHACTYAEVVATGSEHDTCAAVGHMHCLKVGSSTVRLYRQLYSCRILKSIAARIAQQVEGKDEFGVNTNSATNSATLLH